MLEPTAAIRYGAPMLPALQPTDALFLDFDGTLVDIAREPGLVEVPPVLLARLRELSASLAGALALVSGRPVADLDTHLHPLRLAAAGEHGAELRFVPGAAVTHHSRLPEEVAAVAQALADECPGVLVELKTASTSVHFRKAPEWEATVVERMREVAQAWPAYELLHGKMVVEFKPAAVNKGLAIRELAGRAPFAGRRPVFVGDDTTDEAGFAVVNELDGISVRVGVHQDTAAQFHLPDVAAVHAWLHTLR